MQRQRRQLRSVANLDRKNFQAVDCDNPLEEGLERFAQLIFAQTHLDCNLPIRRRADMDLIGQVIDQRTSWFAQARISKSKPQQGVCVEQKPHHINSSKSLSCSSSSDTIVNLPFIKPGTRRTDVGCCDMSFAIGAWSR